MCWLKAFLITYFHKEHLRCQGWLLKLCSTMKYDADTKNCMVHLCVLMERYSWTDSGKKKKKVKNHCLEGDSVLTKTYNSYIGLPMWLSGKESAYQCRSHRRHGFDLWVRKIPWRRAWKPTPVFLLGESHGQRSLDRL